MCPECYNFICVCPCPEADEESVSRGKRYLRCTQCNEPIYTGEEFYTVGLRPICLPCVKASDFGTLLPFFHFDSAYKLYEALGAVRRMAYEVGDD